MNNNPRKKQVLPIAFVVMPFGEKRPSSEDGDNIPDRIDFDQLWDDVLYPVLAEKYTPVRADQDVGPLIIVDMIQRLAAADLVVADVTLRNANVYWEIGVRQAAKPVGCVLIAAEWARPAFDLEQIRQVRYPLPASPLSGQSIDQARHAIRLGLDQFTDSNSPVFEAVPEFPDTDATRLSSFQEYARQMDQFRTQIAVIRRSGSDTEAMSEAIAQILEENPPEERRSKAIVWEIIRLVQDHVGWDETLDYISRLPQVLQDDADIRLRGVHALSKAGQPQHATVELEKLIDDLGETSERCGILGGVYKELWTEEEGPESQRNPRSERYLRQSIAAYEAGMYADLNRYYCSSNLSRLYRSLDSEDPELLDKATKATMITLAACQRALRLDRGDEWLKPTLLTAAFDQGQVAEVRRLVREIEGGDRVGWKLRSTLKDLGTSLDHHPAGLQETLASEVAKLEALLPTA